MDPILEEDEGGATLQLPKIDYRVSITGIAQIVLLLVGGIGLWVHQSDQITALSNDIQRVESSIATLPTQSAEISQMQAHATQTDSAISLINSQIRDILADTIKNTADIENIKEASQTRLRK